MHGQKRSIHARNPCIAQAFDADVLVSGAVKIAIDSVLYPYFSHQFPFLSVSSLTKAKNTVTPCLLAQRLLFDYYCRNILFFFLCDHNCPQGLAPLAECLRLICATIETEAFQYTVLQFLKLLIATSVYSLQFFYLIHSSPVYKCRVLSMLWSLSFLEAMRSILKLFLLLHSSFKAYESVLTSCGDYDVLILCLLVMQSFCLARCVYNGKDKNVSATDQKFVELRTAYLLQFYFCFTFLANQS